MYLPVQGLVLLVVLVQDFDVDVRSRAKHVVRLVFPADAVQGAADEVRPLVRLRRRGCRPSVALSSRVEINRIKPAASEATEIIWTSIGHKIVPPLYEYSSRVRTHCDISAHTVSHGDEFRVCLTSDLRVVQHFAKFAKKTPSLFSRCLRSTPPPLPSQSLSSPYSAWYLVRST